MRCSFVDEGRIYDSTGLLKNEYLRQHFAPGGMQYWLDQTWTFAVAFGLTMLMIFVIPRLVLERVYESERRHEASKRKIKLKYEQQTEVARTRVEEAAVKTLKAQEKQATTRKRIQQQDPSVLWAEEYESLKRSDIYNLFDQLIECLYVRNGNISVVTGYNEYNQPASGFALDQDMLAYADTNGLVEYNRSKRMIVPTDKGKYFIKRYQADTNA